MKKNVCLKRADLKMSNMVLDEWMDAKAVLKIAYSNQKLPILIFKQLLLDPQNNGHNFRSFPINRV
jgi:hypothetical protein